LEKGRQNMGFLKKLMFWKKRSNNTPTKVDACVSTEGTPNCDAAIVSMATTVMCVVYTQTEETRMNGGDATAAAATVKQEYERQHETNTQKIREKEEELVVSKRFTADLKLNINSVEQQVKKYVGAPVINWSDDCECRQNFSTVADLLKKFIIT
jgi:hypothetical protein